MPLSRLRLDNVPLFGAGTLESGDRPWFCRRKSSLLPMLKDLRAINQFYGRADAVDDSATTVSGNMGRRNRDTGYYDTGLFNGGIAPGKFIGITNARGNVTTELDLSTQDFWSDN